MAKTTKRRKHPAEGVYYITLRLALRAFACYRAVEYLRRVTDNQPEKRVPITRQLFVDLRHAGVASAEYWCLARMQQRSLITSHEHSIAFNRMFCADDDPKVEALLDLLHTRAQREGRLP